MKRTLLPVAALLAAAVALPAFAQKKYDPGASDTEIKIGNTNPYSGPASAYGAIGKTINAYFRMVNERGGINKRKVNFITYDDGYSPLKTVPQLFVATGATKWNDPKGNPWTMGWQPNYQTEARIYAKHILQTKPNAKIAVLYQNDDYGKDYLKGFEDGLGAKKSMIVAKASYEVTEPTVDSQILQLKSSGADVFFNITTPKFAAQAIRAAYDTGWKPTHYLNNVSNSVGSVLKPAGVEKGVGIITSAYVKDPTDKRWANDAGMKAWRDFMAKYNPDGDTSDPFNVYGYSVAATLEQVLKQCGDTLTRENVMKQAASLKRFRIETLLPGITISTGPGDFAPIEAMQLER